MKPVLKFLAENEIQVLHQSALKILNDIGMRLPSDEALSIMKSAGAKVTDDAIVKIPNQLVDDAIGNAPKRNKVTLYARDPEHDVTFNNHDPAIACMTMATHVIDPYTGERRSATNEDLARLTWLADQLENIKVNGGLVTPQEVPGDINDWYTWATCIKNTSKHITGGVLGAQCVRDAMQLDSDLLVDYADLVFCNECMGAFKRVSRELVVDEDTMALELIKEIGHGGTFLDHAHTFENFRAELWLPQLMEHRNWDNWETDGALDIRTVSLRKVINLLETKPENQLSSSVEAEIDKIVKEAQQSCEAS